MRSRGVGGWLKRLFGPRERGYEPADEDLEAFGTVVEVIEQVTPDSGRINFRGTAWNACSVEQIIEPGEKARIVYRDNLVWMVEPYAGPLAPGERD